MKDKNKIEIRCDNCKHRIFPIVCNHCEDCSDFSPSEDAYQARISELHTILETVQASERTEALEARIQDLQAENALLKDGESHIMDVKMSPEFVKSIIRAVNSEVEIFKRELRFTDDEINLIRNTFQELIWEDDECDWSAEKKIVDKCYDILKAKERTNNANIHNKR